MRAAHDPPRIKSGAAFRGNMRQPDQDETRFPSHEVRMKQSGAIVLLTTSYYRTGAPEPVLFFWAQPRPAAAIRQRSSGARRFRASAIACEIHAPFRGHETKRAAISTRELFKAGFAGLIELTKCVLRLLVGEEMGRFGLCYPCALTCRQTPH
jgi:hypothetical protein